MNTLVNTTYYPAILLHKRWREGGHSAGAAFELDAEIRRIRREGALCSVEVSELERWSADQVADGRPPAVAQAEPVLERLPATHGAPAAGSTGPARKPERGSASYRRPFACLRRESLRRRALARV
jgi:hypothetical protein